MEKNPAEGATVPKYKSKKRDIWTADELMRAINATDNKLMKLAFYLCFTATLRQGELLGLTWDCVEISDEAIAEDRAYIVVNKEVERVSRKSMESLKSKDIILVIPGQKPNCNTVRVLKTPKTESSNRKIYIPSSVARCLVEIKKDQEVTKTAMGDEYMDYDFVMATAFGVPVTDTFLRAKMQQVIKKEGLPEVVFHSLRHTSVTYKLKLTGGDIKSVQGDSGHSQADMVTGVYGHILDEERRRNAQLMERAFYKKENLNPNMKGNMVQVPEGVDAEALMKVLGNPEMMALLQSMAQLQLWQKK